MMIAFFALIKKRNDSAQCIVIFDQIKRHSEKNIVKVGVDCKWIKTKDYNICDYFSWIKRVGSNDENSTYISNLFY